MSGPSSPPKNMLPDGIMAVFRDVSDLPPAGRREYYARYKTPTGVRDEVESLLRFDEKSTGQPNPESWTAMLADTAEEFSPNRAMDATATEFGSYRVIRLLGSGGMGSVYLAERTDGELDRQVAIKVAHAGANFAVFQERFLAERRILASLNHPGIAHLLDAGRSDDGQPYLVMEYIEGAPIDEYCSNLPLRKLLRLFLSVCEAVSYAHRNLIIHRDLKPSNILIDAAGQPKLLDFGIARILDTAETGRTQVRVLTPEYASPEQMEGEAHSTATDVYSLGAVLHKLLTGTVPASRIPREVECIVLRAMRREPEERYATVDALAGDISAVLEDRPVSVRSGEVWYRTRKFLRRHWMPVAAAAVTIAGLSAGLYVANRERLIALERFSQVRDLANNVFQLDEEIRNLPGATKGRHALVSMSLNYLARLGQQAGMDHDLALEIGSAYHAVAKIQGVPGGSNLGELAAAEDSLQKAGKITATLLSATPHDRRVLMLSAEIDHDRMIVASTMGRDAKCTDFAQRAASRLDTLLSLGNPSKEEASETARLFADIALANSNLHHSSEAIRFGRRSVELAKQAGDPDYVAAGLSVLSNILRQRGDLEAALQAATEARAVLQGLPEDYSRITNLIVAAWRQGRILGEDREINLDRPQEAEAALQFAYDLADRLARRDPADYASRARLVAAARDLGNIVRHHDPERALAIYEAGLRRNAEIHNAESVRDRARLLVESSYPLRALHRERDAKQRIDTATELLRGVKLWPAETIRSGSDAEFVMSALGDYYSGLGATKEAARAYQELFDKLRAYKPAPETDLRDANGLSFVEQRLAELDRASGRIEDADALDRTRRNLWEHWDAQLPRNSFVQRQLAAALLK
jgi:tRNA A-37 threonylcarbamoyl transferase component Bud32/tetratricopeptide (TPR) repeat protein